MASTSGSLAAALTNSTTGANRSKRMVEQDVAVPDGLGDRPRARISEGTLGVIRRIEQIGAIDVRELL